MLNNTWAAYDEGGEVKITIDAWRNKWITLYGEFILDRPDVVRREVSIFISRLMDKEKETLRVLAKIIIEEMEEVKSL